MLRDDHHTIKRFVNNVRQGHKNKRKTQINCKRTAKTARKLSIKLQCHNFPKLEPFWNLQKHKVLGTTGKIRKAKSQLPLNKKQAALSRMDQKCLKIDSQSFNGPMR